MTTMTRAKRRGANAGVCQHYECGEWTATRDQFGLCPVHAAPPARGDGKRATTSLLRTYPVLNPNFRGAVPVAEVSEDVEEEESVIPVAVEPTPVAKPPVQPLRPAGKLKIRKVNGLWHVTSPDTMPKRCASSWVEAMLFARLRTKRNPV